MLVSDSQLDSSHAVRPARTRALLAASPTLAPYSVTATDPLAALFRTDIRLITSESALYPDVKLPARPPIVTEPSRVRITPCPDWHRTELSDSHVVPSHALLPNAIAGEYPPSPMPPPCTVTLMDPVASRLARPMLLARIASEECAWLRLPTRELAVATVRRLVVTPLAARQARHVSDPQVDRSHTDCPIRTD